MTKNLTNKYFSTTYFSVISILILELLNFSFVNGEEFFWLDLNVISLNLRVRFFLDKTNFGRYFQCNDNKITEIKEIDTLSDSAYVLFYRGRDQ